MLGGRRGLRGGYRRMLFSIDCTGGFSFRRGLYDGVYLP